MEKTIKLKNNELLYNLTISSDTNSIKFVLNPESSNNNTSYESIYTLEDLQEKNKIFLSFESIDSIRNSIEKIFQNDKYTIKEKDKNMKITLQGSLFEDSVDIDLILYNKDLLPNKIKKKEHGENLNNQNQYFKSEKEILDNNNISNANDSMSQLKNEINLLKQENKKLTVSNQKLFKKYNEYNQKIGISPQILKFKFRPGDNYLVSDNGLVALKCDGGYKWNCYIIGDTKIPLNSISKWKIQLKNFKINQNVWNILVGIGPENNNKEENFYKSCWSLSCGNSKINIKNLLGKKYMRKEKKIKKGDIIEVIVDRNLGYLSFGINGVNYGIACQIPMEGDLYPVIAIHDIDQIIEIIY